MTEAIYKVGDILELDGNASFPRQFGMFPTGAKIRCVVLKCDRPGFEFIIYTLLVYKIDGSFDTVGINQKDLATAAKRVGHIDISSFLRNEESAEPDYAMLFTMGTIVQSVDLKNENEKLKAENKKLKAENKALSDTLSKSEAKAQSRLDRNEVLKRENEELRGYNKELEQAFSNSEEEKGKLTQKISCADKLLAEAANRLYQGRAHLNISAHN